MRQRTRAAIAGAGVSLGLAIALPMVAGARGSRPFCSGRAVAAGRPGNHHHGATHHDHHHAAAHHDTTLPPTTTTLPPPTTTTTTLPPTTTTGTRTHHDNGHASADDDHYGEDDHTHHAPVPDSHHPSPADTWQPTYDDDRPTQRQSSVGNPRVTRHRRRAGLRPGGGGHGQLGRTRSGADDRRPKWNLLSSADGAEHPGWPIPGGGPVRPDPDDHPGGDPARQR